MTDQIDDGDGDATDGEEGWRFALDEVDENGIVQPEAEPIEPERVSVENALFVTVGVLGTLLVFVAATL